jgi:predicted acyltransferase
MLVTPTGGEAADYPLLRHAHWNGWTFSDLIFPAFVVTSGASLAFLLRPPVTSSVKLRLVKRVVSLVAIGILYNSFGGPFDFSGARVTGVLQLIGVAGGLGAVAVLLLRRRDGVDRIGVLAAIAVATVALYGIALAVNADRCQPPENCSPLHSIDQRVVGDGRTYGRDLIDYDPEGVLVMVAASALAIVGYIAGQHLRVSGATGSAVVWLVGAGTVLVLLGLGLDVIQPINKRLHTPAFSSFAAGVATISIAVFAWLFDAAVRWRPEVAEKIRAVVTFPFTTLGRNALVVFLGERILTTMASQTKVGAGTLQEWILANWIPYDGSTAYLAYGFVLLGAVLVITLLMRLARWHIAL